MDPHPSFDPAVQLTKLNHIAAANLDLMRQANIALLKGMGHISREIACLSKASFESAAEAGKAALAAKSLRDVVAVNADYTRMALERLSADTARLGEMGLRVMTDAFAPIRGRVTASVMKKAVS
jgi:phasin family protein